MFPSLFLVFPLENIVSSADFCFQDANIYPSMRAVAKILRARASEHRANFCEQLGEGQILRAL